MSKTFTIDGIEYSSLKDVGKAYKKSSQLLNQRMKAGMTIEQAAKEPIKKKGSTRAKPVDIDGEKFDSVSEACRTYETNRATAYSRSKAPDVTIQEAIKGEKGCFSKKNHTNFRGKPYNSKKQCAEVYDVPYKSVMLRMKRKNITFEESMEYYIEVKHGKQI